MSISDDVMDRFLDGDVSDAEATELMAWLEVSTLWDGRIDELALFDRALSDADVRELYPAALEQIGNSQ